MTWFIFSLLSITALATAELTQQFILNTKKSFEARTSAVLTFLVQSIFTIPIILIFGLHKELFRVFESDTLPYMLLGNVIGSVAMIFYLKSFQVKNISISTIFISFSVVVSTVLGILLFNETLYPIKILGIVLILLAIVSLNINNLQLEKLHKYGLLAGLLFGLMYTLDKKVVLLVHPITYIFWAFSLVSLFGFLTSPKSVIQDIKSSSLKDFKPIIISGIGYFLYNLATFFAYTYGGEVGRIDAINNSQVFLIILVEFFIFKQKDGVARKLITAAIAFAGVLILGLL